MNFKMQLVFFVTLLVGVQCAQKEIPTEKFVGKPELVSLLQNQPAGVGVSQDGRIFLTLPRFLAEDSIEATVVEVLDRHTVKAFPSLEAHAIDSKPQEEVIVNAQSVIVDGKNRLWILDNGSISFGPTSQGGPKLLAVDLTTNQIVKTIIFDLNQGGVLDTTFLNDIRIDLSRGEEGTAFISDSSFSGPPGIIIVDLASGESWRQLSGVESTLPEAGLLPVIEGLPILNRNPDGSTSEFAVGVNGIAISPNGDTIFYNPLSSRRLFSVSADVLADKNAGEDAVAKAVTDLGEKGGIADGLESDSDGNVYVSNLEHNAVLKRRASDGMYETIVSVPELLWPDTLAIAQDGFLYVTAGQLHRLPGFNEGVDMRVKPFTVWKVKIDASPIVLS